MDANSLLAASRPIPISGCRIVVKAGNPYHDPAAFAAVREVRFGAAGRNILRAPGVFNTKVSLFRVFPLTERSTRSSGPNRST